MEEGRRRQARERSVQRQAKAFQTPEQTVQDAARHRWSVTEASVKEHGRTMGCPRCSIGAGIHNAVCRRRIEGILLQQSRAKAKEDEEPQGARTLTKADGA